MKENDALAAALLTMLVLVNLAFADVITTYDGGFLASVVSQPVTPWFQATPCVGAFNEGPTGFSRTLYAYTLNTTSGYRLTSLLSDLNTAVRGEFSLSLNAASLGTAGVASGNVAAYVGITANGASVGQSQVYPASEFPLNSGTYALKQTLLFPKAPVNSALQGAFNYSVGGAIYSYDLSEKVIVPSANVLNLLNGQNFFVTHIDQGDHNGSRVTSTSLPSYPKGFSSSTAASYWGSGNVIQPALEMVAPQSYSAGAVFWSENYAGNSVRVTLIGTYANYSTAVEDGFEVYMFLSPPSKGGPAVQWAISSSYNWSIPYEASLPSSAPKSSKGQSPPPSKLSNYSLYQGDIILPTSNTTYLMIQWDPYWQVVGTATGKTGQFNVWVVNNTSNAPSTGPKPAHGRAHGPAATSVTAYSGVGNGYFRPSPQDYICLSVTYYKSNNTVSG
ncbi:MAG: hypothetical protein ACP5GO_06040, partial [Thermoprotei archaeon]